MFGAVAHYAASSEDVGQDGSVGHVELNGKLAGISAAVGYITTDKDAGLASISKFGDSLSPFDAGNYVFSADAKSIYGTLAYSIADIDLGLVYGQTTYSRLPHIFQTNALTKGFPIFKGHYFL